MNDVRVIGSHNSYKLPIEKALRDLLSLQDSARMASLQYGHLPLSEQLDLGLRNLEIDLFHDPVGGRFANPKGLEMLAASGQQPLPYDEKNDLSKPGFKVFHVQDIDFRSHKLLFEEVLKELKYWSDQNPDHFPVFITLEAKDKAIEGLTPPLKFAESALDSIDLVLNQYMGTDKLITPDWVRGEKTTLEDKILQDGWPLLRECKGRFLFILDDAKEKRALYIKNYPGLSGRVMFTNSPAGTSEAAFMIINDPKKEQERIKRLVKKGYMIRTRADAGTREARTGDYSKFEAALSSMAHVITTDYYQPSQLFESTYSVRFKEGGFVRHF
ncbi:hypothetical protein FNH22_03380 [Fulvivirga sp. M361]|nr:hypothetical protein FNH22_03380 [Fulvivirga sp. M361]